MPLRMFDQTLGLLERLLDARGARHQAIAANLANQDTPGYQAVDVSFQETLNSASGSSLAPVTTHAAHLSTEGPSEGVGVVTHTSSGRSNRLDGNTVNVEHEMAKLAENTLLYQAGTELLSAKFRMLKNAIMEGR
ncbi:MAG: flagellar basal body rod protein FlgB [Nitrospirae bacterium]|nr:flagellar basal body rod protein FlgB [Nitrospirota bacterium]